MSQTTTPGETMANGTRYSFSSQAKNPDEAAKVLAEVTSEEAVKSATGQNLSGFNIEFLSYDITIPSDWVAAELSGCSNMTDCVTRYRSTDDGTIEIQLFISKGSGAITAFTLPANMFPTYPIKSLVYPFIGVEITTLGEVKLPAASGDCTGVIRYTPRYGVDDIQTTGMPISIPCEMQTTPKAILVSNGCTGLVWDFRAGEVIVKDISGVSRQVKTKIELVLIGE
jgi:hypothetical protein